MRTMVDGGYGARDERPDWFLLGEELMWPLVGMGCAIARTNGLPVELRAIPELALCHHASCLKTSIFANGEGCHSAAICLVRQSIEALTVFEVGLQPPDFAAPLLGAWNEGKMKQGELRRALERDVWSAYGEGLWDESWAEFYANLTRGVQPYAHYTTELQGWQFVTVANDDTGHALISFGLETQDPLKMTRVALLHMLLSWMLGRILLAHGESGDVLERRATIALLGRALGQSKLLWDRGEWWAQLSPHMFFKPGHDWRDS
jgi:hypothetical protein